MIENKHYPQQSKDKKKFTFKKKRSIENLSVKFKLTEKPITEVTLNKSMTNPSKSAKRKLLTPVVSCDITI